MSDSPTMILNGLRHLEEFKPQKYPSQKSDQAWRVNIISIAANGKIMSTPRKTRPCSSAVAFSVEIDPRNNMLRKPFTCEGMLYVSPSLLELSVSHHNRGKGKTSVVGN
jgi:hypothetical protein